MMEAVKWWKERQWNFNIVKALPHHHHIHQPLNPTYWNYEGRWWKMTHCVCVGGACHKAQCLIVYEVRVSVVKYTYVQGAITDRTPLSQNPAVAES